MQVTSLDDDMCDDNVSDKAVLTRVKECKLDLSGNFFPCVPASIASKSLSHLIELNISFNRLDTISVSIATLQNLVCLNVSGNHISSIPVDLNDLKKLVTLQASHNNINRIDGLHMPALQHIDLKNNQLLQLPENIKRMSSLKFIDVSCNCISMIPAVLKSHVTYCDTKLPTESSEKTAELVIYIGKGKSDSDIVQNIEFSSRSLFIFDSNFKNIPLQEVKEMCHHIIDCDSLHSAGETLPTEIVNTITNDRFGRIFISDVDIQQSKHILKLCKRYQSEGIVVVIDTISKHLSKSTKQFTDGDHELSELELYTYVDNVVCDRKPFENVLPILEKHIIHGYFEKRAKLKQILTFYHFNFKCEEYIDNLHLLLKHFSRTDMPEKVTIPEIRKPLHGHRVPLMPASPIRGQTITMEIWNIRGRVEDTVHSLSSSFPEACISPNGSFKGDGFTIFFQKASTTHRALRLVFQGTDTDVLWQAFITLKEHCEQYFPYACTWILCPKCMESGEVTCRRIPTEICDLEPILRKANAYCLNSDPPRIIPGYLLLPKCLPKGKCQYVIKESMNV